MPKQKHHKSNVNYFTILLWVLVILSAGILLPILFRQLGPQKSVCDEYFRKDVHKGRGSGTHTTLMAELHGVHEQQISDCLAELTHSGDHLLIEAENIEREIPCDSVHPAYAKFNGKLKCYGFDVGISEERRLFSDCAFKANFLAKNTAKYFVLANDDPRKFRHLLKEFAKFLHDQPVEGKLKQSDGNFNQRMANYLLGLVKYMNGMTTYEMQQHIYNENQHYAKKAEHYRQASRNGPTNDALNAQIKIHQKQLSHSGRQLFLVAGKDHLDLKKNKKLQSVIEETDTVTVLTPK